MLDFLLIFLITTSSLSRCSVLCTHNLFRTCLDGERAHLIPSTADEFKDTWSFATTKPLKTTSQGHGCDVDLTYSDTRWLSGPGVWMSHPKHERVVQSSKFLRSKASTNDFFNHLLILINMFSINRTIICSICCQKGVKDAYRIFSRTPSDIFNLLLYSHQ